MAQPINFFGFFSEITSGLTGLAMMGGSSPFSLVFFGLNLAA